MDESNWKPNKVWVDKGSELYNRSMKSFLKNNNKEIVIKKLKILYRGHILLVSLTKKTNLERFTKIAKIKSKRVEKVIKRKSDELYVK